MQTELDKNWTISNSELQRIPIETITLPLEAQKVMKLIDKMEEDDDVNAIYVILKLPKS